ncbi:GGDEF domain-containing protein [Paenibacillus psychroresistens]|uniref:GGDEF domain-containing protein n=1 Tax=Paenibacillus psychroresistens TaxID=1778678 RepID=A0A6B8RUE1_9BACL|nr:GGDEF domain-containing protein [Paenibacillus psychroresistens]QGQ99567.1 GGDEF domain-containing protein [Paenibacillus psychroresistens]
MNILGNDHKLEIIFSLLRWFFVVASIVLFFEYYNDSTDKLIKFSILLFFGIIYMTVTEVVLHRKNIHPTIYSYMTKGGVIFDYMAILFVISLTGGTNSPLFPVAYLLILHASVYWGLAGGIVTALFVEVGYSAVIVFADGGYTAERLPYHVMNYIFVLMVGILGGFIVARGRKHFSDKNYFENMAKKDYLTGLFNHRSFQEQLKEIVHSKMNFILVMADIDLFKLINDHYGHIAGDKVLKEIGSLLEKCIPKSKGSSYRYGGEEFAILLYMEDLQQADNLIQQFREQLLKIHLEAGNEEMKVTMSFGAVLNQFEQPAELVAEADSLLYRAKAQGRNQIVWSTPAA